MIGVIASMAIAVGSFYAGMIVTSLLSISKSGSQDEGDDQAEGDFYMHDDCPNCGGHEVGDGS